ncbi:hypothetical protein F7P10_02730 [Actinomadura sp. WMMB 499]|nr:hypothetical protein F7P10_02730 [Actinomadura sp. WMMB 499]
MTFATLGPWAEPDAVAEPVPARHPRPLPPLPAVGLLAEAAALGEPAVAIVDVDWEQDTEDDPPRVLSALLRGAGPAAEPDEPPDAAAGRRAALLAAAPPERLRLLRTAVRGAVAEILGYAEPEAVGDDDNVTELGMSSFAALELATRLGAAIGATVRPAVVFDHPTTARLAEHLSAALESPRDEDEPAAEPVA